MPCGEKRTDILLDAAVEFSGALGGGIVIFVAVVRMEEKERIDLREKKPGDTGDVGDRGDRGEGSPGLSSVLELEKSRGRCVYDFRDKGDIGGDHAGDERLSGIDRADELDGDR